MQLKLPDFPQARVLVLGDVMLDRYWHGSTSRISPEAPVPVVRVGGVEDRPGGAANVALNVVALGAQAELMAVVGDDEAADVLERRLREARVASQLQRLEHVSTITKLRVLSRHQQLIRLDFEDELDKYSVAGFDAFAERLPTADVVVLSDYAKGTLHDCAALIRQARDAGVAVLVDPKGTDFGRYAGASLITPNRGEFEAVVGPCRDDAEIEQRARALITAHDFGAILVTRGEEGMSLITADGETLHLPAHAQEVYDVTGAGDTVIAVLAAAYAAGSSLKVAVAIANLGAAIVVGKLGTATVTTPELSRALHGMSSRGRGPVTEEELGDLIAEARRRGERIVLTNGCFDILHAGHVAYLEQARARGDRLIVAVNDDASVARLKGPTRPVVPLAQRMAVLAGLAAVDWVVPFSEDTPERLICAMKPDVLVKGGDYRPEEIAGSHCVWESGGEVVVLDFVDGCSTTSIIERARQRD